MSDKASAASEAAPSHRVTTIPVVEAESATRVIACPVPNEPEGAQPAPSEGSWSQP